MATKSTSYTRFEKARIVGARALQIGMGAPVLVKHDHTLQNPVELALQEFDADLIPITVKRSVPPRAQQKDPLNQNLTSS
jgi:DNA-directed RNA polymerase subunit K